jgi:trehalose synthase
MLGRLSPFTALLVLACACGASREPLLTSVKAPPERSSARMEAPADQGDVAWMEQRSMLHQAAVLARHVSGSGTMWRHAYANPEPRAASAMASVWFTAYPGATITRQGETVLQSLGDEELWRAFREIGIKGMHTGPMKRSGGVRGREYTPTVDGNFDRIGTDIDPTFGSESEYRSMTKNARASGAIVIGDIIPGHSGKGPDFRLAERGYGDYPGLYHMVEIAETHWSLLPPVPPGKDSVNLSAETVDQLKARGYIVGQLPRTIFYEKGVKETDFSATDAVLGVDGKKRRWVYLHYFKEGQPTFNWLDPSFAAERLVLGDALHSLSTLGESMLRLDANGFLGIEIKKGEARAWSEGHPLSVTANQLIAGLVRKLGGFTFQELNLTLEDIKEMSHGGPDLSYDFVTRPAYHHALVTGDASFLRLMLSLQKQYGIDPAGLIHALQNHDELTLELVHFWTKHKDDTFLFRGRKVKGHELRDTIRAEVHDRLLPPKAPYNLKASNGVSCTTVSLAAASLGISVPDLGKLDDSQREGVLRAHLLLAMYNAMQPGVFALSGWDLVGAAPLPEGSVKALLADGDTRWINRGAYDLLGRNPTASKSAAGLPRAVALWGPLPDQLRSESSFASRLKKLLSVRSTYRLYEAEQIDVPSVKAKGLLVLIHRLPERRGIEITALNFGRAAVNEAVTIEAASASGEVTDLLTDKALGRLRGKQLALELGPHEGKILLVP